ncbi:MAG: ATP-dependent DNA ligase [Candidatus Odinarchaeum yellowstonii]|uniref:DNA ligase n=1 Tax=Odinarchaeota yellowstonii (strain LCB_4) TaxID=1841599 RepID=A0AAF0D1M1_ODILC|nr:MAG: ATP-dependent DNA ligase [Candidatus Odinarchaeum yellowstonii]
MLFREVSEYYQKLEDTTKRLELTDILKELFSKLDSEDIDKVIYMTQGKLHPDWYGYPEIGMAEKSVLEVIAATSGLPLEKVTSFLQETGDIGLAAEKALKSKVQKTIIQEFEPLTVQYVYNQLDKITRMTGKGSSEDKKRLFTGLLHRATPLEARYISRIVTGNLRLGIADMTIMDALSIALAGSKASREDIESSYNICSDLGLIAKNILLNGVEWLKTVQLKVGVPVRMMLAQRLATIEEILEKIGRCAVEYKYDGERFQIHKIGSDIKIFSRRLEVITDQYPDAVEIIRKCLKSDTCITEAECVAVDPDNGEILPFQQLMHRRRKYEVEEAVEAYPVKLFFFDCLYNDGQQLINKPYLERRGVLEKIVNVEERCELATQIITDRVDAFEKFFHEAVSAGCEGVIAKSIGEDSLYQAGGRGWLWIKYKRDYRSELTDTLDLVVVGAYVGKGRRAGTYGTLLLACYDPAKDVFKTVARVGSGFKDEDLSYLSNALKQLIIKSKNPRVESNLEPDYWIFPKLVIEVKGAELTLSPIHTCAFSKIKSDVGLAIRFPRFTGRIRDDKSPEESTTEEEVIEMYNNQLKRIK